MASIFKLQQTYAKGGERISGEVFNIFNDYLKTEASTTAAQVAVAVSRLVPAPSDGSKKLDDGFFFSFWKDVILVAEQIPHDHPAMDKVVRFMRELTLLPDPGLQVWDVSSKWFPSLSRRHAMQCSFQRHIINPKFQGPTLGRSPGPWCSLSRTSERTKNIQTGRGASRDRQGVGEVPRFLCETHRRRGRQLHQPSHMDVADCPGGRFRHQGSERAGPRPHHGRGVHRVRRPPARGVGHQDTQPDAEPGGRAVVARRVALCCRWWQSGTAVR